MGKVHSGVPASEKTRVRFVCEGRRTGCNAFNNKWHWTHGRAVSGGDGVLRGVCGDAPSSRGCTPCSRCNITTTRGACSAINSANSVDFRTAHTCRAHMTSTLRSMVCLLRQYIRRAVLLTLHNGRGPTPDTRLSPTAAAAAASLRVKHATSMARQQAHILRSRHPPAAGVQSQNIGVEANEHVPMHPTRMPTHTTSTKLLNLMPYAFNTEHHTHKSRDRGRK